MTPEEQWKEVNYPSFLNATLKKVRAARLAMANADTHAPEVTTYLNQVPIKFTNGEDPNWITIKVGTEHDGTPIVSMRIPKQWLAG